MKKPPSSKTTPRKRSPKPIVHAIQVYDLETLGYPLAVFEGIGQFQDIAKGDSLDGKGWPSINGHNNYARVYRVVSIRHTLTVDAAGQVKHLKSLFVEPVVPPRRQAQTGRSAEG